MIVIATLSYIQFQSPLHRGNHFNNGLRAGELIQLQISVPSSSGKSLQLCIVDQASMRLTISVPSSSGKSLQRRRSIGSSHVSGISVPSSSGKSLQRPRILHAGKENINFSPLFIGEITSTPLLQEFPVAIGEFQSPLHRGNHFNRSCSGREGPRKSISVPSSSGKSLQRLGKPLQPLY